MDHSSPFAILIYICTGALCLCSLGALYRAILGPTLLDRILAIDGISISVIGIAALLSMLTDSTYFIELIIVFSLLAFVSTVAFIYISRHFLESDELAKSASQEQRMKGKSS